MRTIGVEFRAANIRVTDYQWMLTGMFRFICDGLIMWLLNKPSNCLSPQSAESMICMPHGVEYFQSE